MVETQTMRADNKTRPNLLKTSLFAIDGQAYTDEARKQTATRVIFRTRLRDKALFWYQNLAAEVRGNWESVEAAFLTRFALVPRKEVDQTRFLNLVFNFRQRGRSIVEYTREGDHLNAECPEKFRDVLGHQFIAGLDDKGKVDLVQVYLGADKTTVTYAEAKQAVGKAYQRLGEPSPLDQLYDKPTSPPPTPIPALQSELVALLQSLRIPQAPPSRDNPFYRPNYANASVRDQNDCSSFYRGIYCYNCYEEGHYSTSCTRPVVSGAQREANKRAIDELQRGSRQYPRGPGPALGPPLIPAAPAAVASGGREREEQGGRRMNNIGSANVVILKRPVVEEADNSLEYYHTYPITALTRSHKSVPTKVSEPKNSWPTSRVTKPAARNVERPLAQQASRNLERLNERTAWTPSPSPPPPEDEEINDTATIRGDSYSMRGALPLGQDRQVQFVDQDDGVHDQPIPQYYQKNIPPLPRLQEAAKTQDETFPIKMAEGKDRFQVGSFLETPVPLPMWQRLDKSPRSKLQLARAIASSWLPKREERPAGLNLAGIAAVASKSWTPPAIETIAHKDKAGYDQLLLRKWTYKVLDRGPGAKTIWGRSIPKILALINGQLVRLHGFSPAEILLGNMEGHGRIWKLVECSVSVTIYQHV